MPKPTKVPAVRRIVALCYVRRSLVRDDKDLVSPQIQRDNIQRICALHGWTPEWYEDAEGHKSAMHEKNRPGWMALKARLDDPDVVALVANDLSRLHRKGWRIGDLLDFVDHKGIKLVLADPSKHIDFSTPQGRLFAQLSAIFDEWYAMDVSLRRKANIAYRKSKNITVGLPLFGTKRNKDGYLMPTDEGAWLLPNGSWQAGTIQDEPPAADAIWRGYYDCAFRIMELYVTGLGRARVCSIMQSEGWAFRDRYGQPSPLEVDDVRRVTSSWPEYGGAVLDKKSSTRNYREIEPNDVPLDADRAVFDIHLLRRVGEIIRDRSFSMPDTGRNKSVMAYALSGLVYCAGCERIAVQQDNVRLRSKLSGIHRDSYRHRPGLHCDCQRRAVPSKLVEGDFLRLVQNLTLAPEFIEPMLNLAALLSDQPADEREFESKRTTAIARARKRLDAARHIFEDGDISREEYVSRKEKLEREITHWQNYTTETQRTTSELMVAIEAVNKIARLWEGSNDEDRYHGAKPRRVCRL
ncbi:MAG: recombinase family protein [Chloroflexi bacterium]|nr:recombinase family protein [Chloroflexota bacterium]